MRAKLSYCSILLLAGLAVVSVLVIAASPFTGTPAAGAVGGPDKATVPSTGATPGVSGGADNDAQPWSHHHNDGLPPGLSQGNGTIGPANSSFVPRQDE